MIVEGYTVKEQEDMFASIEYAKKMEELENLECDFCHENIADNEECDGEIYQILDNKVCSCCHESYGDWLDSEVL